MPRVAVVTEGPSDYLLLRALIESLGPPGIDVVPVHPEQPLAAYPEFAAARGGARRGAGWRGVEAWCREFGSDLELFMRGVVDQEYDILVIHLDASMAANIDCEHPCPPATTTTDCIRDVVLRRWLGLALPHPRFLVIATPSKTTDTWVLAVREPTWPDIECSHALEVELARRRILRRKNGQVKKPRAVYERLADEVAARIDVLRGCCGEAERFVSSILAALARPSW